MISLTAVLRTDWKVGERARTEAGNQSAGNCNNLARERMVAGTRVVSGSREKWISFDDRTQIDL